MTKEELIKELELLADSCDSNYALEMNGYNRGVLDALSVVNKYFALSHVSSSFPSESDHICMMYLDKQRTCMVCGKENCG